MLSYDFTVKEDIMFSTRNIC